jgi:transposase
VAQDAWANYSAGGPCPDFNQRDLKRERGEPLKVGLGPCRGAWRARLLERCREADFTLRGLVAALAERGMQVAYKTVWAFVHAEGLTHGTAQRRASMLSAFHE